MAHAQAAGERGTESQVLWSQPPKRMRARIYVLKLTINKCESPLCLFFFN